MKINTKILKDIFNLSVIVLVSFSLGWFMRGDIIYSKMFKNMVSVELPKDK